MFKKYSKVGALLICMNQMVAANQQSSKQNQGSVVGSESATVSQSPAIINHPLPRNEATRFFDTKNPPILTEQQRISTERSLRATFVSFPLPY